MTKVSNTCHATRVMGKFSHCRGGCRQVAVLILAMILNVMAFPALAQTDADDTQDLIRSAMVYNFCKFVQWPHNAPGDSLILGVVGDHLQSPDFSSIAGKNVGSIPIAVRMVDSSDKLRGCQLVYIANDQRAALGETLSVAQAESILTISELDGFCNDGGIIQLVERRGKLRFFINRGAADDAQLLLSSQLLKVAKIVEGG